MNYLSRAALPLGLATLLAAMPTSAADTLKPEQIAKVRELVKPNADEDKWERIPWHTNSWDKQQAAIRN